MATPRRPYVRVRLGLFAGAMDRGCSSEATLLLAFLITHPSKRALPGLLTLGPAGLAETMGFPEATVRRGLAELTRAELVIVDTRSRPPLLFVRGAIDDDPPASRNAVIAMARQVNELPESTVRNVVVRAVEASLVGSKLIALWRKSFSASAQNPSRRPMHRPSPNPGLGSSLTPGQGPLHIPQSFDPSSFDPSAPQHRPEAAEEFASWLRVEYPKHNAGAAITCTTADAQHLLDHVLAPTRDVDRIKAMALAMWTCTPAEDEFIGSAPDRGLRLLAARADRLDALSRRRAAAESVDEITERWAEVINIVGLEIGTGEVERWIVPLSVDAVTPHSVTVRAPSLEFRDAIPGYVGEALATACTRVFDRTVQFSWYPPSREVVSS